MLCYQCNVRPKFFFFISNLRFCKCYLRALKKWNSYRVCSYPTLSKKVLAHSRQGWLSVQILMIFSFIYRPNIHYLAVMNFIKNGCTICLCFHFLPLLRKNENCFWIIKDINFFSSWSYVQNDRTIFVFKWKFAVTFVMKTFFSQC